MKFPKPWHRKGRGWYVTLDGQQVKLSKKKADALDVEAALNYYIEKMNLQVPLERWVEESLYSPIAVLKLSLTQDAMDDGWLRDHSNGRVFADVVSFDFS